MPFMFEKLEVYQKAADLSDRVISINEGFGRGHYLLADRLNRASLSISTNIAEGNGPLTKSDRKHFFVIARGSVQECVPLLEIARRRGLLDADLHSAFKTDLDTISRMLSGLIKGIENSKL
ncbi:MAG: hypothetical protein Kow0074_11610 [Candidatus Zixiibacteriota bacterium]